MIVLKYYIFMYKQSLVRSTAPVITFELTKPIVCIHSSKKDHTDRNAK